MESESLVVEAIKRGYALASKIIPAQYLISSYPPVISIPSEAAITEQSGNLCFKKGNDVFFKGVGSGKFLGLIYDSNSGSWAKIVESRSDIPVVGLDTLRDFPKAGCCWSPTEELLKYLQKTRNAGHSITFSHLYRKGLVWSGNSIWTVASSSGYYEYKIEQLKPFLIPENLALRPLTPDECCVSQDFPDKWCIGVTLYNFDDLTLFMRKHKKDWEDYKDEWVLNVGGIFHYPPYAPCAHSSDMIELGYTMISTNQFLTHVLTHTDKQQIINPKTQENGKHKEESGSCKIQRPHLTVGDSDPIRATGIRCSKIKIQVRSGHLPD